jgi:hypothetical protein
MLKPIITDWVLVSAVQWPLYLIGSSVSIHQVAKTTSPSMWDNCIWNIKENNLGNTSSLPRPVIRITLLRCRSLKCEVPYFNTAEDPQTDWTALSKRHTEIWPWSGTLTNGAVLCQIRNFVKFLWSVKFFLYFSKEGCSGKESYTIWRRLSAGRKLPKKD